MKKVIPVIVVLILLGIGGYFFLAQKGVTPQTGQSTGQTTQPKQQGDGVITSIKDAIIKQMSLKCEYPDDKGNTVTTYIKGELVRVMGYTSSDAKGQGQMLMRDDKLYVWDDQTKKGTMMTLKKPEAADQGQTAQVTPTADQKAQTIENLEKYKDSCKAATIPGSIFEVPTNVQFTDYDQMMKDSGVDIKKMMEQYKTSPLPSE